MSLKAFHIVFVIISILLCAFVGVWEFRSYSLYGGVVDVVISGIGFISTFALIFYARSVFRKYKDISYI
jgi:hypothetical protein